MVVASTRPSASMQSRIPAIFPPSKEMCRQAWSTTRGLTIRNSPEWGGAPGADLAGSDQRVVSQQVAVRLPLADADEDVLGQPVVLALGAFEGGLAAQVIFVVRHRFAALERPVAQALHR